MTISMYQVSVPPFIHMLQNLSKILEKAEAYCVMRKVEPSTLLNMRIFPDMFPLTRQVQIAADAAKFCAGRLAGVETPSFADDEASFGDLKNRIAKTITFLKSFKPEQIDGTEDKLITYMAGGNERSFKGQAYLQENALLNFYFHVTTTYALLRHAGVEVGKRDYLGPA